MNDSAQSALQSPTAPPTPARRNPVVRAIVVLVKVTAVFLGITVFIMVVVAVGMKKEPGSKNGSASTSPATASSHITKQEWKAKVVAQLRQDRTTVIAGYINCSAKDFFRAMGKPDKTQAVGDNAMLYYRCSDGTLQLVCSKLNLEANGLLGTTAINEY